jgi:3-deoxy-7-phosphoheptulonate synthase
VIHHPTEVQEVSSEPLLPSAAPHRYTRRVDIADVIVGGTAVPVIAGPCAVEAGYVEHALVVADAGAAVLRGCVLKPRTHADSFQGLGVRGLPLLDAARRVTGLPVISEPLEIDDIDMLRGHIDALMIGARSMHNTPLLRAAGRSGLPVILKRGMSATLDEWLGAAGYITAEGNQQVILCERGIRTFETATRNTLDLSAIAVLRERTDLPIAVDPSHATGNAAWVPSLAAAALAAGADALLIECHPDPEHSVCDAAQAITPAVLEQIVQTVEAITPLARPVELDTIAGCRDAIDTLDSVVIRLLERRAEVVGSIQALKRADALPRRDAKREHAIVERLHGLAPRLGRTRVQRLVHSIITECVEAAMEDEAASRELSVEIA